MAPHAVSAVFLASSLLAQAPLVLPGSHATLEGSSSTNVPFGRSTPSRVQCVYDRLLFQAPVTITGLAFRIDGGAQASQKVVDLEIRMSTMAGGVLQLGVDFAQNRGLDQTIVLPRQILTLPTHSAIAAPNSFLAPLVLSTPFAFDPAMGSLCVELVVHGQPPGTYSLDLTYVCTSPVSTIGPAGCPQPGNTPLRVESSTTQVMWGRPWVARVLDASPGAFVALTLGTIESGPWSGFVLPQDLAILGAPSCFLSIDVASSFFGFAAGDGSATFPFVMPNNPAVVGFWIRYQGAATSPGANALGLVTSQAQKVQVCGWEPVGRLWSSGITAATGTREIGVAPVLQLQVQ
ncbi:MAG: hypothetical protein KDC98_07430 [Planctomycetes bacterium]|nr:hypothetical protein [Planctomycetota bacterium]